VQQSRARSSEFAAKLELEDTDVDFAQKIDVKLKVGETITLRPGDDSAFLLVGEKKDHVELDEETLAEVQWLLP